MRNLRIATVAHTFVEEEGHFNGKPQLAAYDSTNGYLLLASAPATLHCVPLRTAQEQWSLLLLDELEDEDCVAGVEFIMEQDAVIVGSRTGHLLLVFLATRSIEGVGRVEGGICKLSYSPDGELLAVASATGQLLLMTQDWHVLYEISLHQLDDNIKPMESVQISWRGDGKYFATLAVGIDSCCSSRIRIWERDTGALHSCTEVFPFMGSAMDWIPSGSRIAAACNMLSEQKPPRIKFFERNGLEKGYFDLGGPSEAIVQLVEWNCSSDLLAVLTRSENWDSIQIWSCNNYHWYLKQERRFCKNDRVLFFWDPECPTRFVVWTVSGLVEVVSVCWESAITYESVALVIDGSSLLVTPLKLALIPPPMFFFELIFQSPVQSVAFTKSLSGNTFIAASLSDGTLAILTLPGVEMWYDLEGMEYKVSRVKCFEAELNISRLRLLTWVDSDVLIGVMDSNNRQYLPHPSVILEEFKDLYVSISKQGTCTFFDVIVEIQAQSDNSEIATNQPLISSNWLAKCTKLTLLVDAAILSITRSFFHKSHAYLHLLSSLIIPYLTETGPVSQFNGDFGDQSCSANQPGICKHKLLSPCIWVQMVRVQSRKTEVLVGLDEQGRLQVETYLVSSSCTSFTLHLTGVEQCQVIYILYTTKQDMLHVINLEEVLRNHTVPIEMVQIKAHTSAVENSEPALGNRWMKGVSKKDVSQAARPLWERGAKLIAALGGADVGVILQTARGNLEIVYPRILVIGSIAEALLHWNFKDAIILARRHHINLNMIVDYRGWQNFAKMAGEFVKQVNNLQHVTELVFALKNTSFMDGIYRDVLCSLQDLNSDTMSSALETLTYMPPDLSINESEKSVEGNKLQCVLKSLREYIENEVEASSSRELCILTTLAHSDPPELEEALKRIKQLREKEIYRLTDVVNPTVYDMSKEKLTAEDALRHLLWLSDFDSVFNAALGLYDLHLAAMVALNSQRDPKEFLPFLQELEKMPAPLLRYNVDYKLHRFESALRNLAAAGDFCFDQCLSLIKSRPELFSLGKEIFKDGPQRVAVIEAWGEHMLSEERYEDAAVAFCLCSQLQKALGAYRTGGIWKGVCVVARLLGLSEGEIFKVAEGLSEELQALGKPGEAARLTLEYCKDTERAICLFVESREWNEAMRVALAYDRMEKVKGQVEPAAIESAHTHISNLEEGLGKVEKYFTRFSSVRQQRILLEEKMKMEAAGVINEDEVSDTRSDISSMSAYTTGSKGTSTISSIRAKGQAANVHSHGRRKSRTGKIRAGSPGEEFALVEHLRGFALPKSLLEELRELLHVLVLLGHGTVAEKLQHLASQYQSRHQSVMQHIGKQLADEKQQIKVNQSDTSKICWWWDVLDVQASK